MEEPMNGLKKEGVTASDSTPVSEVSDSDQSGTTGKPKIRKAEEFSGGAQENPNTTTSSSSPGIEKQHSKRRRIVSKKFSYDVGISYKEEKFLSLATANSLVDTSAPKVAPVQAPVYHPTLKEWEDPMAFIRSIQKEGEKFGIVKIVAPPGWKPPFGADKDNIRVETKLQVVNRLGEGVPYGDGKTYTVDEYEAQAGAFREAWIAKMRKAEGESWEPTVGAMERCFWDIVGGKYAEKVKVEYGSDIDTLRGGSGFPVCSREKERDLRDSVVPDFDNPEYYASCGWNLNNIPNVPSSFLTHISDEKISGINVPWMYMGMLFSAFCWHNEDSHLYSTSYMHYGAAKTWYGIPGSQAHQFIKAMRSLMPRRFSEDPDLLDHLVTMVNPSWLIHRGVDVCTATHTPGSFIVTFPSAYHAGFSHGYNCAEAVNFALSDWIPYGRKCVDEYSNRGRRPVVSFDKLICTVAKLDSHMLSKRELHILRDELLNIKQREGFWRKRLFDLGVRRSVRIPDSSTSDKKDMQRACSVCNQPCSLSCMVCQCSPLKTVCVKHHDKLCACDVSSKCFVFWRGIKDLEALLQQIDAYM